MTWIAFFVVPAAIILTAALTLPPAIRAFRRWRLRRKAPKLKPYDENLRERRGRQRP